MNTHEDENERKFLRFEALCRQQGLPVTVQRRVVLEAVLARDDHPGADDIYEDVQERIPGVSRTTVYRVLDLLVRLGIITKACHPGAISRFDRNTDLHHHLVCLRCEAVIDVADEQLNTLDLPDTSHLGFEITDFSVQLRGICINCRDGATVGKSNQTSRGAGSVSRSKQEAGTSTKETKDETQPETT